MCAGSHNKETYGRVRSHWAQTKANRKALSFLKAFFVSRLHNRFTNIFRFSKYSVARPKNELLTFFVVQKKIK